MKAIALPIVGCLKSSLSICIWYITHIYCHSWQDWSSHASILSSLLLTPPPFQSIVIFRSSFSKQDTQTVTFLTTTLAIVQYNDMFSATSVPLFHGFLWAKQIPQFRPGFTNQQALPSASTRIYTHICTHTDTLTHIQIQIVTLHSHTYTLSDTHIYTLSHTLSHIHTHRYTHTNTHTDTHRYTHTQTHTYIQTNRNVAFETWKWWFKESVTRVEW